MNPKAVGEVSEAMVLARLVQLGYPVLIPFGNNQRYDLVYEENGKLVRAQVKTGRLLQGTISFSVASKNGFTGVRTGYANSVDVFLVYSPHLDKVYRVPVSEAPSNEMRLRVDPLRKFGPTSTVRWAMDYEV